MLFRAELKESLSMALKAVAAHKLRSILTLLGVLIGVFSIIVVMTALRVVQTSIESEMSGLGANTFAVTRFPPVYFGGPEGFEKFWRRRPITMHQAKAVKDRATLARNIGIETDFWMGDVTSRFNKSTPGVQLVGGTPENFLARSWDIQEGRPLLEEDLLNARHVCVLGNALATNLFPFATAVGEKVKFDGISYSVVGVIASKGSSSQGNQDKFAVIPLVTGLNRYGRIARSLTLYVQAADQASYEDAMEQIRGILRASRKVAPGKEDDFEMFSNDSLITQFKSFTLSLRIGVAVISSIALLAAGIGIMNIMLVSVTERTREIGIRRAVGAKKRNIMAQFIMEATVLCQLGGIAGVILGILGGNCAAFYLKLPPVIPVDWTIIGLVICSIVGIVFGTYPAYKAANLDPIESLRYE